MLSLIWLAVLLIPTEDPSGAPQTYTIVLENPWVRVIRVRLSPHEKTTRLPHPTLPTVYVYLRAGGAVRFRHGSDEKYALNRKPVKAGEIRVAGAVVERHETENLTETPHDYVRVELKTQLEMERLRGRFSPVGHRKNSDFEKVQVQNPQLRVVQLGCKPGGNCLGKKRDEEPSVLIALTPARVNTTTADRSTSTFDLETGDVRWLEPGKSERWKNAGDKPAIWIRIDLRSGPVQ